MNRIKDGTRKAGIHPAYPVSLSTGLPSRASFVAGGVCMSVVLLSLSGCGPKNFVNENDRLREENLKLKHQIDELNGQVELRLGEIEGLREKSAGERAIKDADPPVLAKLAFDRYSGALDSDGDGKDDLVRMYLTPLDHQGRLLPVAGRLKLQAVAIQDNAPPALLAERTYEPREFDKAYRANITGYHYTLEMELPASLDPAITSVTVRATLTEAVTGQVVVAEQIVGVKAE